MINHFADLCKGKDFTLVRLDKRDIVICNGNIENAIKLVLLCLLFPPDESDMGLRLMMNIRYMPFSKSVCEKIFDVMLKVIRVNTKDHSKISQTERIAYLVSFSSSFMEHLHFIFS